MIHHFRLRKCKRLLVLDYQLEHPNAHYISGPSRHTATRYTRYARIVSRYRFILWARPVAQPQQSRAGAFDRKKKKHILCTRTRYVDRRADCGITLIGGRKRIDTQNARRCLFQTAVTPISYYLSITSSDGTFCSLL